ncbi:SURF1 family protein [Halomonas sp. NCCP-2165]|nr:SURF1 family protein [Halomonas sp. NCCP-2165]
MASNDHSSRKPPGAVKRRLWWVFWPSLVILGLVLGGWQWQRAAAKAAYLEARAAAPALVDPDEAPMGGATLTLSGEFVAERTLFLDNRVREGRVGVAVLTPLVDAQGRRWLIQRGFIATGPYRVDPEMTTPEGPVTVSGTWQVAGDGGLLLGPNREGRRLQRIALEAWPEDFAHAGWLHQQAGAGAYEAWWRPSVMPPGRHRSYAFQWWGLALAALVIMILGGRRLVPRPPAVVEESR